MSRSDKAVLIVITVIMALIAVGFTVVTFFPATAQIVLTTPHRGATGTTGSTGATGATGATGPSAIGDYNSRGVLNFAQAYQAATAAKPAFVTVKITCVVTVGIGSPQANTVEMIVGSTTGVASGTGYQADVFRSDLSVTLISLGWTGQASLQARVPANYYFAVRRTTGTGCTITDVADQTVG